MRIIIVGDGDGHTGKLEQTLADFGLDWQVSRHADVVPVEDLMLGTADAVVTLQANHLSLVRAENPGAIRVLLMDSSQSDEAMHALDCAHRLLRLPLEAGDLVEAIESVADLRGLLANPDLKQAIGRIGSLPSMPRVYIELTQLLRDPDASNAEIADVLGQDPAIAAKVLRLSNSAYFSGGREISDLRAVVTRLGHQAIRRLVLASEVFGTPQSPGGVDRDALQDRALRTSRLAGRLLAGASAELAATAGLLTEVGRLLPDMQMDGQVPHYAETGAYLLALWGLPTPIVEAVAYHHQPSRMRSGGFWVAGAVHVAAALVGDTAVDEDYLRSVGVHDRLPRWREMEEQLAEMA